MALRKTLNMNIENDNPAGTEFDGDNVTDDQAEALGSLFLTDDDEPVEGNSETDAEDVEDGLETSDDDEDNPDDADDDDEGNDDEDDIEASDEIVLNDTTKSVRLPDGTTTTVQELINGNLRHADYTRKRMEAAETEKAVIAEQTRLREVEQTIANERQQMAMVLQQFMPQQPDISMLETDPIGYQQAKAYYDQATQALQHTFQAQQQHQQATAAEQARAHEAFIQNEVERFKELNAEFSDPEAFGNFQREAVRTLHDHGFTKEEISSVSDHRMLQVIRDAMAYRKLQAQAPKAKQKVEGKPPVMRQKRKSSNANTSKIEKRISAAQRTGDATSVSDILGELLS